MQLQGAPHQPGSLAALTMRVISLWDGLSTKLTTLQQLLPCQEDVQSLITSGIQSKGKGAEERRENIEEAKQNHRVS